MTTQVTTDGASRFPQLLEKDEENELHASLKADLLLPGVNYKSTTVEFNFYELNKHNYDHQDDLYEYELKQYLEWYAPWPTRL